MKNFDKFRDKVGWFIATLGLYIATKKYRKTIEGSIRLGLATAAIPAAYEIVEDELKKRS